MNTTLVRHTYMLRRGFDVGDIASWDGRLYIVNSGRYVCLFDDGKSYDGKNIEAWCAHLRRSFSTRAA